MLRLFTEWFEFSLFAFEFSLFLLMSSIFSLLDIWVSFTSSNTQLWAIMFFIPFQRLVMINELLWRYCRRMAMALTSHWHALLCVWNMDPFLFSWALRALPVLHCLHFIFFFIYVSSSLRSTQYKTLRWTHRSKMNWSPDNCLVFSLCDVYMHEDY